MTQSNFVKYVKHDTLAQEYLNSSIHLAPYLEPKFLRIFLGDNYQYYKKR